MSRVESLVFFYSYEPERSTRAILYFYSSTSLVEVLLAALEVVLARRLLPLECLLLDLLAILILGVIDFVVIDIRGIVVYRSFLLMSRSYNSVVKLKYLLTELIVLLVRIFDLGDSVSDRLLNLPDFPLSILVLATSLGELFSKVVGLFLEERNIRPLLVVRVAIRSLPSIVVLG